MTKVKLISPMFCKECGSPMRQLDPRPIYDPQPTSYVYFYTCDEPQCPIQGAEMEEEYEYVEKSPAIGESCCTNCGNPLRAGDWEDEICRSCLAVIDDYGRKE